MRRGCWCSLPHRPRAAAAQPVAQAAAAPAGAGGTFPVRVRRVRLQDAKLDFTDLSLRPQFAARIHELQGVVTGLSTDPAARTRSNWMAGSTTSAPCVPAAT